MAVRGQPRKRGRPCKAARLAREVKRPCNRKIETNLDHLDIGNELVRWANLKEGNGFQSDEEVAKYLLDLWDMPRKNKKENGIFLGPATARDFESYQLKTKKSADEIIRFFLRLDIEPGQSVITAHDSVCRVFESLKSRLKVRSNEMMTTLLEIHAKHTKWCSLGKSRGQTMIIVSDGVGNAFEALRSRQNVLANDLLLNLIEVHAKHTKFCGEKPRPELERTVKKALRDEILHLIDDGILMGTSRANNSMDENQSGNGMGGNQPGGNADLLYKDLSSQESAAKKRSRKSQPQRVVIEQEHLAESDVDDGLELSIASEINTSDNRTKHTCTTDLTAEEEMVEYNYVMSSSMVPIIPTTTSRPQAGTAALHTARTAMDDDLYDSIEMQSTETTTTNTMLNKDDFVRNVDGQYKCPFCPYKASSMARMKKHNCSNDKRHKCSLCNCSYAEKHSLKHHIKTKHEDSLQIKCEACPRNFRSKGGLRFHRRTWHPKDFEFWCELCAIGFNNFMFYETHMNRHGEQDEYTCNICTKSFPSLVLLSVHKNVCLSNTEEANNIDLFRCEKCSESFQSDFELKSHINKGRCNVTRFRCKCGSEFKWRAMFDNHRAICKHSGIDTGSVEIKVEDGLANVAIVNVESITEADEKSTNVDFDESSNSVHITNMESGEQFIYDLTGEGNANGDPVDNLENLNEKKSTWSTDIDPGLFLPCRFCSYKTDKMSHLKRHEMTHSRKKYKCRDCPKSFSESERLKTHQNAKHKGKSRYKCDQCSRTFLSKGGIMYHQQTKHNNFYKYKCETCDKGFNTIQHYLGHKNTHSGVRPFVCEKCNIGFAYPSVLTSHKRVCKGKIDGVDMNGKLDLYPCKECKEKFAMFSALQEHLQEAHGRPGQNRYLCECGADFELHALYDLHKTTCNFTDKSVEVIMENIRNETAEISERDKALEEEFKQLSPEKFNAIISNQPVFPV